MAGAVLLPMPAKLFAWKGQARKANQNILPILWSSPGGLSRGTPIRFLGIERSQQFLSTDGGRSHFAYHNTRGVIRQVGCFEHASARR